MKKLKKFKLRDAVVMKGQEMMMITGGYGYSGDGYRDAWYGWKCWCTYGSNKFMMSGTWEDVLAAAEVYCPTSDVMCDAQM